MFAKFFFADAREHGTPRSTYDLASRYFFILCPRFKERTNFSACHSFNAKICRDRYEIESTKYFTEKLSVDLMETIRLYAPLPANVRFITLYKSFIYD